MQEIAHRAGGVHPSTVSLALRNAPSISVAVRERLQQIAARLGYRRDPMLDAFNARRVERHPRRVHPVIAWVVDADCAGPRGLASRSAEFWRGGWQAASALHHQLELFSVAPNRLPPARLAAILDARGIDCVVLASLPQDTRLPGWRWDGFSAAKIDCLDRAEPAFTVSGDLREGARLAVRGVRARGYRRIGLLLNASAERSRQELLLSGYLVETQAGPIDPPVLRTPRPPAARALAAWVRTNRLDAVIGDWPEIDTSLAGGRRGRAARPGWASLDVTDAPADTAGIVLPLARIGALAVEQVVNLSRSHQRGLVRTAAITFVPGEWRDGRSLPWAAPA